MRTTCVAIVYPTGSIAYMPSDTDKSDRCGKPAVDYQEIDGKKYWLCAEHWDQVRRSLGVDLR